MQISERWKGQKWVNSPTQLFGPDRVQKQKQKQKQIRKKKKEKEKNKK